MAEMSARMVESLERRRRVKCEASWEVDVSTSSSGVKSVAVVSQSPGSCGAVGLGRIEVDVGMGIWRESDRVGLRLM